ncbi:NitT/TauT family transport system permease protein [Bathymodiolus platifrons methanotrophic gill symbiont]|uniref:ABC transporter permease n=1 Tax=Bathymodiolus platifrons methanotrophic gill symbiont TaxID=113268 RepID=UPI0011CAB23F|nr:ABC transporter permease subunit [Bathymodiolus platifrons methanotrophic gill symbiont]TXK97742.1 ABC transporter permease [Methylococcaceae bacterium HT1]TXL13360.1 ABC transporter permease [Methylococcaceae bacterium HT3]TXL22298.1 ABC transporter permease [Methylococcaceae bacterium HT2]TXL15790.1 ABC transporter permease [Methylococcaceae bacterium HT3]GFO75715.1 NitT/TauT family transport system permease protein [Bathymodiolus platifrons methanotrophic gill symbiont]
MPFTFRPSVLALLSISLFLALWYGLAIYLNTITLPTPFVVANVLIDEINSGQLPYHLSKTLYRLLLSFSIAMLLGCAIGITLGRHKQLDCFFDNWLVIFLNVPALVTIILCYVWFGLVESAAILAVVINKLPNVIVTIREGTRALDKDLLDMAKCYRFSKSKTLRHVIWPQLHPFVMAATRSGLALIWKIVLVVEMLGRSDGMGYQLHLFFQLFDVASILAYTFAFVTLIQGIEILILKPLDKKAQRWRR